MGTYTETPQLLASYQQRVRANRQLEVSRFALPLLYATMGISLGSLAGAYVALGSGTTGVQAMFGSPTSVRTALTSFEDSSVASAAERLSYQTGSYVQTSARTSGTMAASEKIETVRSTVAAPPAEHRAKAVHAPALHEIAPGKAPVVERYQEPRETPQQDHPSRPAAHPVTRPARTVLASAEAIAPAQLEVPVSFSSTTTAAAFYTEGDITVAEYDAVAGTIVSSDGRTFSIGATVSEANATSWSNYRSDVHYRCGSNGSCTLVRPGVIATDARLI